MLHHQNPNKNLDVKLTKAARQLAALCTFGLLAGAALADFPEGSTAPGFPSGNTATVFGAGKQAAMQGMTDSRQQEFLNVEAAFRPTLRASDQGYRIEWDIAPGYYLYKRQFRLLGPGQLDLTGKLKFSRALQKYDGYFGQVEIYYHAATLSLAHEQLPAKKGSEFTLRYQGCAEQGLCYPEQFYRFELQP